MEMWFSSIVKKVVLKTNPYVGVLFGLALFMCYVTFPDWFNPKCSGIVDEITAGRNQLYSKTPISIDVYYFKIKGESATEYYSSNMETINKFGINNIIGHKVDFKYEKDASQYRYHINELFVDKIRVYPEKYLAEKIFLFVLLITLTTGTWTIWGFVINYKKTGEI